MIVWVDGRIVAPDEPVLSALDHGLLVGDGVFESVRVDGGVPFALDRHLRRLARSVTVLGLHVDFDDVRAGVEAVLACGMPDPGRIRIMMTSGTGPLGSTRGHGRPFVSVIGAPFTPYSPSAAVAIASWPRNERSPLAGVKSTSYAENALALAAAHAQGADEAIFANIAGDLCEGTGSNVFVVVDGRLVTPPLSAGCLAGVTRDIVCELLEVAQENVPIDALARADEAFLTSTTRRVQPIRCVDGRDLAQCPGPLTIAARDAIGRYAGPTSS